MTKHGLLMAKSLVDPSGDTVPLRVVNLTPKPVTVYKDTVAGVCSAIEGVTQLAEAKGRVAGVQLSGESAQLSGHLAELWDTFKAGLTTEERQAAWHLLLEAKDTFAASKEDLGRTTWVQHKARQGMLNLSNSIPVGCPWPNGRRQKWR